MKKIAIISIVVFLSSCTAKLAPPSDKKTVQTADEYPDESYAALSKGKALYEVKCAQCHAIKQPSSETAAEWHRLVPKMSELAIKKGKDPISAEEQELIIKYLTKGAKN